MLCLHFSVFGNPKSHVHSLLQKHDTCIGMYIYIHNILWVFFCVFFYGPILYLASHCMCNVIGSHINDDDLLYMI